ncbi:hypothetical protein PspS35_19415 [Pseudomonas sp. S35]|uniref:hypothetical protein n=1 Tax=Pseudomonas sp. S35 TaxID=1573719 RepID=UPI00132EA2A3|nr:hypothetical protein [Pseudomonas sp. S35]QHF45855.1 hypothetical protein PspS35_19415 [Pseudomonas sp. S35]
MSTKEAGGPAFPLPAEQCIHTESQGIIGTEGYGRHAEYGMTLRDYFAAKAMAALIANYPSHSMKIRSHGKEAFVSGQVIDAYMIADAMLAARSA